MKAIAIAALLMGATQGFASEPISIRDRTEADGSLTLVHSVLINAPHDAVWNALTTAEGWKRWAVPVAFVDFRIGGEIETSYDPKARSGDPANIRNRILAFVPGRMLAIQVVQAPPGFATPETFAKLWSVIDVERVGQNQTRVTLSGLGYDRSDSHQALSAFFRRGNAQSLDQLRESLEKGPIDWTSRLGGKAARGEQND